MTKYVIYNLEIMIKYSPWMAWQHNHGVRDSERLVEKFQSRSSRFRWCLLLLSLLLLILQIYFNNYHAFIFGPITDKLLWLVSNCWCLVNLCGIHVNEQKHYKFFGTSPKNIPHSVKESCFPYFQEMWVYLADPLL